MVRRRAGVVVRRTGVMVARTVVIPGPTWAIVVARAVVVVVPARTVVMVGSGPVVLAMRRGGREVRRMWGVSQHPGTRAGNQDRQRGRGGNEHA